MIYIYRTSVRYCQRDALLDLILIMSNFLILFVTFLILLYRNRHTHARVRARTFTFIIKIKYKRFVPLKVRHFTTYGT